MKRVLRLNSLLKEVLSDVISKSIKDPRAAKFITITEVDISKDLRHAKVNISIIGTDQEKAQTIEILQSASRYIAAQAAKEVILRYFPELTFKLDTSADKFARIDTLLSQIDDERKSRSTPE
jgi:ribosome-binding factor A